MLVLGLLAVPVFSMRLGMTDNGTSPTSMTTRRAYDLPADGFGPGFSGPLILSAELDGATADDLAPLVGALEADTGVQAVSPVMPNDEGTAAVARVIPTTSPQDEATTDLVHRLRDEVIPQLTANQRCRDLAGTQSPTTQTAGRPSSSPPPAAAERRHPRVRQRGHEGGSASCSRCTPASC